MNDIVDIDENQHYCCFCGKAISDEATVVQGDDNVLICFDCIKEIYEENIERVEQRKKNALINKLNKDVTPSSIKRYLDEYIIGQESAKKVLSVAVYNHYKSLRIKSKDNAVDLEKSNIILLGPSGCGKTAILKALSKFLNVPFAMADASTLTAAGYVGADVETVLQKLILEANGDIKKAQKGIVYIDEIDKIARKGENLSTTADPGHEGVQQALLKMIEGSVVSVPPKGQRNHPQADMIRIDTSNILFIVGGAFENIDKIVEKRIKSSKGSMGFNGVLKDTSKTYNDFIKEVRTEDLKKFGMLPELLGRLPIICPMEELDKKALIRILTEPKNALVKQYQAILQADNVKLSFTEKALEYIADKAIKRKTGARSLRSILEEELNQTMYELPDKKDITAVLVAVENNNICIEYIKEIEGVKIYDNICK